MQIDELSSSNDPLLQPFKLKHLTLKNRVMSTSHACGLDENGLTGNKYQAYHEEKARGGLALTMFGGSASVAPDSLWPSGQVDVSTDAIIPLFEQFTAKVHHHGCALMCQISHRLRVQRQILRSNCTASVMQWRVEISLLRPWMRYDCVQSCKGNKWNLCLT